MDASMIAAIMARAAELPNVPPPLVRRPAPATRHRQPKPSLAPVNGRVYKVTVRGRTGFILSALSPEDVARRAQRTPEAFARDLRVSGLAENDKPYLMRFLSADPTLPEDDLPEVVPPCRVCGHDAEDHRRGACASWACVCV